MKSDSNIPRMPYWEAVLLGSTLVSEYVPYSIRGCVHTMAAMALGIKTRNMRAYNVIGSEWSWLWDGERHMACGCDVEEKRAFYFMTKFAHYFDEHVCSKEWSMDKMIDVLKQAEPVYQKELVDEQEMNEMLAEIPLAYGVPAQ